jgi:hypothetical protein
VHYVDATPQLAQGSVNSLRLAYTVELQIDHDVVGIVDRAQDAVAAHARALPANRIAVESFLPLAK